MPHLSGGEGGSKIKNRGTIICYSKVRSGSGQWPISSTSRSIRGKGHRWLHGSVPRILSPFRDSLFQLITVTPKKSAILRSQMTLCPLFGQEEPSGHSTFFPRWNNVEMTSNTWFRRDFDVQKTSRAHWEAMIISISTLVLDKIDIIMFSGHHHGGSAVE